MECSSCGALIPDDSMFCTECGARQVQSKAQSFAGATQGQNIGGGQGNFGRSFGAVSPEAIRNERDAMNQQMGNLPPNFSTKLQVVFNQIKTCHLDNSLHSNSTKINSISNKINSISNKTNSISNKTNSINLKTNLISNKTNSTKTCNIRGCKTLVQA